MLTTPLKKIFSMMTNVLFNSGKNANWKRIVPCLHSKSTKMNIKNGDNSMNKKSTGLYKIGSVLKPLILAIGLDVGEVSMTNLHGATNSKIGQHQIQDDVNSKGIYSTAQILSKSSNKVLQK